MVGGVGFTPPQREAEGVAALRRRGVRGSGAAGVAAAYEEAAAYALEGGLVHADLLRVRVRVRVRLRLRLRLRLRVRFRVRGGG